MSDVVEFITADVTRCVVRTRSGRQCRNKRRWLCATCDRHQQHEEAASAAVAARKLANGRRRRCETCQGPITRGQHVTDDGTSHCPCPTAPLTKLAKDKPVPPRQTFTHVPTWSVNPRVVQPVAHHPGVGVSVVENTALFNKPTPEQLDDAAHAARTREVTRDTYAYPTGLPPYRGTFSRYHDDVASAAFAERSRAAEQRIVGQVSRWQSFSFEDWRENVFALAAELRGKPVVPNITYGNMWWRWNADLDFVLRHTTSDVRRQPTPTDYGFNNEPTVSLSRWHLPSHAVSDAIFRRAHRHFVNGRTGLFYRDMVVAHYLDRGNAGTATVLANTLLRRVVDDTVPEKPRATTWDEYDEYDEYDERVRVRADERLDLIAMAGTTDDFLKAWANAHVQEVW